MLFTKVDAIRLYVDDLVKGLAYYQKLLGLRIIWKTTSAIGLGLSNDVTEIVISTERKGLEVDVKVDNVLDAVETIKAGGGKVIFGPFDIRIGKCAVIEDPWENQYVILDSSKGTFITDEDGNIIGQKL